MLSALRKQCPNLVMMKNKYLWIAVATVAIAALYMAAGGDIGGQISEQLGDRLNSTTTASPSITPTTVRAGTKATTPKPKSYSQLVQEYADRRIQFDERCQATPENITYKNGTTVMLDNRSSQSRVVTIGGVKYSLAGYGYKLVTLNNPQLPKELLISCGAGVNVGRILLQANILQP